MSTIESTVDTVALRAEHLYRFYRAGDEEVLALRGVSLDVRAGELVVIAGPSGSGKSTLLACLAGLDEPDGGTVRLGGRRLSHRPEAERAALRAEQLGVLYQYGNLLEHLTVEANVMFAQSLLRSRRGDHAPRALLASVGLESRAGAYPGELSGGETARAGLAVALANDPSVLIADEPTGELDADSEQRLLDLLTARAAGGKAVLVASHSAAVMRAADRVVQLRDGQVVTS
ncbi:MAG: putative transport system ATP-binding protein [Actinomycetota bacterium]|jgi:putative ABC transport system ATP-binding protein|nr:putative transport system ATP-binding protein [Actinomycetota bacterium]